MYLQTGLLLANTFGMFWQEVAQTTLQCLSNWTSETIDFPFVPNRELMVFRCPNI